MGRRRLISTSDDENESPPHQNSIVGQRRSQRKRKTVYFSDEEGAEESENDVAQSKEKIKDLEPGNENDEPEDVEARPLGELVRVSSRGRGRRCHYSSFEYDGVQYRLEDTVLLVPEEGSRKPYIAAIKDIAQLWGGAVMVTGQWFYRPEEAERETGGSWRSTEPREIFYSFHRDEVPAESVLHKCVVHFIPINKKIPHRKQHPGFIVQKVYDTEHKRLFKLTDKDYEDNMQHEIDILVQKTLARLGDLPDLEPEVVNVENDDQIKSKRLLKKSVPHSDVTRVDGLDKVPLAKPENPLVKPGNPGSACAGGPDCYAILLNLKALTGEAQRDKMLERLLQSIQSCIQVDSKQNDTEEQSGNKNDGNESHNKADLVSGWPDAAVSAVSALEKAAHDMLSSDFQKYKIKMRQLIYNLKSYAALTRRVLNKGLEPAQVVSMGPNELKEGLTAEELSRHQPEESSYMRMTNATCRRCSERQMGLVSMFQTGHGDRYQLECGHCGYEWYASRNDMTEVTIEGPNSAKTVGTDKFEDVEKNLVSQKGDEGLKKQTGANLAVLENQ